MRGPASQYVMVWLLPVVVIGGIFFPALGYLVLGMMLFFFVLAYFRGRFWCSHLCPRGAFLDLVLHKVSFRKKIPAWMLTPVFKWTFFSAFMAFFIQQLAVAPKTAYSIGAVFVRMCLVTTLIAIVLGLPLNARTWCAVCPMGLLQTKIRVLKGKIGK